MRWADGEAKNETIAQMKLGLRNEALRVLGLIFFNRRKGGP